MKVRLTYLADRLEDVLKITAWWYYVWADRMGPNLDRITEQFQLSIGTKNLPLDGIATVDDKIVGTAVASTLPAIY